jgi:AcrR family transcriptional regulator
MTPRPDVSEERKAQIHQAALACFGRSGYHRTTMDDIAEESGLSKGALYWYFAGKKELFISLFEAVMGEMGAAWEVIARDEASSATDKLRNSLALFRDQLEGMVSFFGVMMEAWALTRHDADVEALVGQVYDPYFQLMGGIIQEGVASGEFSVRSPLATAFVLLTLFDGITLAIGVGLWHQDWHQIMDAAEELVLRGLGVEGASADG